MNSNPTILSVDEQIDKIIVRARINNNAPRQIYVDNLKSLISQVCLEVIGQDASMGRDALTYDEKEHINQWLNEQRTKLNKILGEK